MADIFISYSKADRELAWNLSAYLEAEGWSVWWDKSLLPGDPFRDEIMKELAAARAVITIWTENSIKSDWVRAEAGQAKSAAKLIPVKVPKLGYSEIPLPFGEMHTEDINRNDLIRAAVVTQLAKPAAELSGLRLATKLLRYQVLTWVGIIGGSITLFSNLKELLHLAPLARWFVTHWQELTHAFWVTTFGWIGLHVPTVLIQPLTFAAFMLVTVIGIRAKMVGEFLSDQVPR